MEKKVQKKYCNCCGKELCEGPGIHREDWLDVRKEWGYFSGKDGEHHHFRLCENCYDRLIQQFAQPVQVEVQTEWL